jgi:hypothetical protein
MNQIIVPRQRSLLLAHGMWEVEHWRQGRRLGKDVTKNLICNEGLNHILNVVLHGSTPVSPWYMAIFKGNYTPVASATAANVVGDSTECSGSDYTEGTRPEYVEAAAASQSITNAASKATFTIGAPNTIYGAYLISGSTKASATGTLLAVARFATSRAVIAADLLLVTYTIAATSV